jgi:hypothetical protein
MLLDGGLIVTTHGRRAYSWKRPTPSPHKLLLDVPIVVLVDRLSASTADRRGVLQDRHRRRSPANGRGAKDRANVVQLEGGKARSRPLAPIAA